MRNYYVYIYLDPRKPGNYFYENQKFNFQLFYIGLGKNKRDISHLKEAKDYYKYDFNRRNRLNKYKICILRLLERNNLKPIIIRVFENLSREEAGKIEIAIIAHWGRKNSKTGFLSNMTAGGEASINRHTEKSKECFTKWWKLINSDGKEFVVHGLTDICKKYNLNPTNLAQVANGNRNNHKGWNCYRIENGVTIIKDKTLLSKEEHYGKQFSKNVSDANKGRKFTEEHKNHLRKPKKGNTLTKTQSFMNGKKEGAEKRKGTKVLSITKNWQFISPDEKIFNVKGMKEFCEKNNLIPSSISQIAKTGECHKKWKAKELPINFFKNNIPSLF